MKYTLATRGSKLALYQAHFVRQRLSEKFPQHQWEIQTFTTTGDRIQDRPLAEFGGKGVFLKEIEEALLSGKADLAVHSLKDVPCEETPHLRLAAFLSREDPRDVWISKHADLMHLLPEKRVGTSSLRRSLLVHFYRTDLQVELLRGNLDTRLRKLDEGQYDAIVVAAAGLHRLQLFDDSYMYYLSEEAFIPAVGQGIMVVQIRENEEPLSVMLRDFNDSQSETAARIERKFLSHYEGGCHLPVGGLATHKNGAWHFSAFIGGVKSKRMIQDRVDGDDPDRCAFQMHQLLEQQGAKELLAELA